MADTDEGTPDEVPTPPLRIRVSPDGRSAAVRSSFDDNSPGAVSAWHVFTPLPVSMAEWRTEADVAEWTELEIPQ